MTRNILGVDLGSKGALALLSPDGALLEIEDMPILRDGPANRPNVNAPLLAAIVYRWQASNTYSEPVNDNIKMYCSCKSLSAAHSVAALASPSPRGAQLVVCPAIPYTNS